jgi:hypothetical protein
MTYEVQLPPDNLRFRVGERASRLLPTGVSPGGGDEIHAGLLIGYENAGDRSVTTFASSSRSETTAGRDARREQAGRPLSPLRQMTDGLSRRSMGTRNCLRQGVTSDSDFDGVPGVTYIPKKKQ